MGKARWADVSEHNGNALNKRYRLRWFAYRVNDGTYHDENFHTNDNAVRHFGRLIGYIAYTVWPRSVGWCRWQEAFDTFTDQMGKYYRPRMVIMQDIESWGRNDLHKDHSKDIEAMRLALVNWLHHNRPKWQKTWLLGRWYLHQDKLRVIGYGNRGDLEAMCGGKTKVDWVNIVLADYTPGVKTPSKFLGWRVVARQHTNGQSGDTPHGAAPWSHCDMNVGRYGPHNIAGKLGLGRLRWTLR